jgi:hypothetical protein
MILITKREGEEIKSEEMEPPGNRVEFYNLTCAGEAQKNRSPEMMVDKVTV